MIGEGSSPGPWHFDHVRRGHGAIIMYDPARFKTIAVEQVQDAGVTLLLHTQAMAPIVEDRRRTGRHHREQGRPAGHYRSHCRHRRHGRWRPGCTRRRGVPKGQRGRLLSAGHHTLQDRQHRHGPVPGVCRRPIPPISISKPTIHAIESSTPPACAWAINGLRDICKAAKARGEFDMPDALLAIALLPEPGTGILNMAKIKGVDSTDNWGPDACRDRGRRAGLEDNRLPAQICPRVCGRLRQRDIASRGYPREPAHRRRFHPGYPRYEGLHGIR